MTVSTNLILVYIIYDYLFLHLAPALSVVPYSVPLIHNQYPTLDELYKNSKNNK
jgi:hypothetical protein